MLGLQSILSDFCNDVNKFNYTMDTVLDSIYYLTLNYFKIEFFFFSFFFFFCVLFLIHFLLVFFFFGGGGGRENAKICMYMHRCYMCRCLTLLLNYVNHYLFIDFYTWQMRCDVMGCLRLT